MARELSGSSQYLSITNPTGIVVNTAIQSAHGVSAGTWHRLCAVHSGGGGLAQRTSYRRADHMYISRP